MDTNKVKKLLDESLSLNDSLFLVDWKVSIDNKISVLVDGDDGLPIEEIVRISRHIEHNLDREEEDFSLEISSPGVGSNLILPRQYIKNIGRTLEIVLTNDDKKEGKINSADDEGVELKWEQKEPKQIGKGKVMVEKIEKYNYSDIKQALVKVTF